MNDDLLFDSQQIVIFGINPVVDTPERALLRAVLEDAIEIAVGLAPVKNGRERLEARRWLESKSDNWVLPCGLACSFLGIDQGAMLRKLKPRFANGYIPIPKPRSAPKSALKKVRLKSNYRGRVVGAINKTSREKMPKIKEMLKGGASIRKIAVTVRTTRFIVLKIRRGMAAEMASVLCGCGKSAGHKGWCRYLYERSASRRLALANLHERQRARRARMLDAPQVGGAAGGMRTLLQTEIAGR